MKLPTVTIEDVISWGPCRNPEAIRRYFKHLGLEEFNVLEAIDNLKGRLFEGDLLWLILRSEMIPDRVMREAACDWAQRACEVAGWDEPHSLKAIEAARQYARGELSEDELETFRFNASLAESYALKVSLHKRYAEPLHFAAKAAYECTRGNAMGAAHGCIRMPFYAQPGSFDDVGGEDTLLLQIQDLRQRLVS